MTQLDELLNDKVTKLALNGDHVNDIQRQVMESLDKRMETLEKTKEKDCRAVEDCTMRTVNCEIKLEKLISHSEANAANHEKVRQTVAQNGVYSQNEKNEVESFILRTTTAIDS